MVTELTNEGEIPRSMKDLYREFVDSKEYDAIKAGFMSDPRQTVRDWVRYTYKLSEHDSMKLSDHICCTM